MWHQNPHPGKLEEWQPESGAKGQRLKARRCALADNPKCAIAYLSFAAAFPERRLIPALFMSQCLSTGYKLIALVVSGRNQLVFGSCDRIFSPLLQRLALRTLRIEIATLKELIGKHRVGRFS